MYEIKATESGSYKVNYLTYHTQSGGKRRVAGTGTSIVSVAYALPQQRVDLCPEYFGILPNTGNMPTPVMGLVLYREDITSPEYAHSVLLVLKGFASVFHPYKKGDLLHHELTVARGGETTWTVVLKAGIVLLAVDMWGNRYRIQVTPNFQLNISVEKVT